VGTLQSRALRAAGQAVQRRAGRVGAAARARRLGGLARARVAHQAVQVAPKLEEALLRAPVQRDRALKQVCARAAARGVRAAPCAAWAPI